MCRTNIDCCALVFAIAKSFEKTFMRHSPEIFDVRISCLFATQLGVSFRDLVGVIGNKGRVGIAEMTVIHEAFIVKGYTEDLMRYKSDKQFR